MALCLLGLGSNQGDRAETLRSATTAVNDLPTSRLVMQSAVHETAPVGGSDHLQCFLNTALLIETALNPLDLLGSLQQIETSFGRHRIQKWGPRTIDIDILLLDDQIICGHDLVVPHPWMLVRRFALSPATQVAPTMTHPLVGRSLEQLDRHLQTTMTGTLLLSATELRNGNWDDSEQSAVPSATHLRSYHCDSGTIFVDSGEWQSQLSNSVEEPAQRDQGPRRIVATPSSTPPGAQTDLGSITPPPRIVVGCVEPEAQFAPWRMDANPSKDEALAKAIANAGWPFVLIPRNDQMASQLAAAIEGSA